MALSLLRVACCRGGAPALRARYSTGFLCMQCEQTFEGKGCSGAQGVCGKSEDTALRQDLLVHNIKGISQFTHRARQLGAPENPELNRFTFEGLFSTMTNVNFDEDRFQFEYLPKSMALLDTAKQSYFDLCKAQGIKPDDLSQTPAETATASLDNAPDSTFLENRRAAKDLEAVGLQELIVYGLKGMSAYGQHASALGKEDDGVYAATHELLSMIADDKEQANSSEALLGGALKVGEANLKVVQMLDEGHTSTFGHPEPTEVSCVPVPGKCILFSGHDMHDLEQLLKQTEGTGINVYTHGEMLPAHSYPGLKKYSHLAGHYGGPWQLQKFEFRKFPGPIVVSTNCIIEPRKSYIDRIYTANTVGFSGVKHIDTDDSGNKDFSMVIAQAQECDGFNAKNTPKVEPPTLQVGFGHNAVMSHAGTVVQGVKDGHISRFFVIGGCDGNEEERNYFKELAMATPDSSIILTMGCGKYRFNRLNFETVPNVGLPRVLDMGQCNDAYGAVVVASELAKAFECDINDLPLSFAISWFEQKAIAQLLTLLHLGVKNIAIGPAMPAFLGPKAGQYLADNLGLRRVNVDDVDQDLEQFVAGK